VSFARWLDQVLPTVPPTSILGGALGYLHRQGDWLFSIDTPGRCACQRAALYSLVETAKANNVEPYLWLRHVLRSLPTATTVEHFEALLPWNLNAEQLITA
jgi:transposase